ncbi:trypsin-like peptidase domain-containing protein [Tateyamaria omphalii]|uniref:trypsin-like peptidase domain-containing protein n=1 Tax=Tateyamaria omphalii TaxID=299262 RepID=UPI001C99384A|nr:trypsin-like peptidase domain-containing protein [Tateyamaria omphalii]MBY5931403.1 trypsin-like peptidase domain-containing protein [Tateyamaria omphalii]
MKTLILSLVLAVAALGAQAETRVPQNQSEITLSFAPLVRETAPAVVNIYVRFVTQARARTPFMDDPFFERLFEGFGQPQPRVQNSLGSGVILSEDGIVVSNYHVVGQATDIRIVLNDGREYDARVLLGDQDSDLAILKIDDVGDLPFLSLRDSETVEVGELTLAIGNPFGVGQTVSSGIVSGLARSGGSNGRGAGYFIQTDAPINPGNSGGALVDMRGDLLGINTRILSRSGGSNGIGFAIPADLVAAFVKQARDGNDRFVRPWAGATGQAVDADLAETLGRDRPGGIMLAGLHPASPLADAGFEVGDVVLAVDGAPVGSPGEMLFRMSVASDQDSATMTRLRGGEEEDLTVALIPPPDDPPRDETVLSEDSSLPGLTLARINPAVLAELNLPIAAEGVVVLDEGQIGRRVGLRRGDVLQRIDRQDVDTPAQAAAILSEARRGTTVRAIRGNSRIVLRF